MLRGGGEHLIAKQFTHLEIACVSASLIRVKDRLSTCLSLVLFVIYLFLNVFKSIGVLSVLLSILNGRSSV